MKIIKNVLITGTGMVAAATVGAVTGIMIGVGLNTHLKSEMKKDRKYEEEMMNLLKEGSNGLDKLNKCFEAIRKAESVNIVQESELIKKQSEELGKVVEEVFDENDDEKDDENNDEEINEENKEV